MSKQRRKACAEPASLMDALGIVFLPKDDDQSSTVQAIMPVQGANCQPFGVLHGGASIALAESLAGYGSLFLLPDGKKPVGSSVTATHVRPVSKGESVSATATLLHEGKSTHLWNVDINDRLGRLVCTVRVLNHIITVPPCNTQAN